MGKLYLIDDNLNFEDKLKSLVEKRFGSTVKILSTKESKELAKEFIETDGKPKVVYIADYIDLIGNSYNQKPFYFVRKDFLHEDIRKLFNILTDRTTYQNIIKIEECNVIIDTNKLCYVESVDHVCILHFNNEIVSLRTTMKYLEGILSKYSFVRIHRSYLVNSKFVMEFNNKNATLKDGTLLNVGRKYYASLKLNFIDYIE